jgi:hypothetical protein
MDRDHRNDRRADGASVRRPENRHGSHAEQLRDHGMRTTSIIWTTAISIIRMMGVSTSTWSK